jgi:hypothetical protein
MKNINIQFKIYSFMILINYIFLLYAFGIMYVNIFSFLSDLRRTEFDLTHNEN